MWRQHRGGIWAERVGGRMIPPSELRLGVGFTGEGHDDWRLRAPSLPLKTVVTTNICAWWQRDQVVRQGPWWPFRWDGTHLLRASRVRIFMSSCFWQEPAQRNQSMKVRRCRLTVHFLSGPTQRDIRPTGEFLETSFQAFPLLLIILCHNVL